MLEITQKTPINPKRVVIIGGGGFVGGSLGRLLSEKNIPVLSITRANTDLCAAASAEYLAGAIEDGDVVVNAAAIAPCKNLEQLTANIRIIQHVQAALLGKKLAHLINISSDAVYGDLENPISERAVPAPGGYHGIMHLIREIAINTQGGCAVTHVRPTLIYGSQDPHNGYGPNRFARQALAGGDIPLFGKGEERRDHIFIGDLAALLWRIIAHKAIGDVNAATGQTHSFHALAELAVALAQSPSTIRYLDRSGPMPHNGFRPFDVGTITRTFPDFRFTAIEEGMGRVIGELRERAS